MQCRFVALFALLPYLASAAPTPLFGLPNLGDILGLGRGNSIDASTVAVAVPKITSAVGSIVPAAASQVGAVVNGATSVLGAAVAQETQFIGSAIGDATKIVGGVVGQAGSVVGAAVAQATGAINVAGNVAGSVNTDNGINGALSGNLMGSVSGAVNGIASGTINNVVSGVAGAVSNVTPSNVVGGVGGIVAGAVPSSVVDVGKGVVGQAGNIVGGVVAGTVATGNTIVGDTVDRTKNLVDGTLQNLTPGAILGNTGTILGGVVQAGANAINNVGNVVTQGQITTGQTSGGLGGAVQGVTYTPLQVLQTLNSFVSGLKPISAADTVTRLQSFYTSLASVVQNQANIVKNTASADFAPFVQYSAQLLKNLNSYLKSLPTSIQGTSAVITIAAQTDAALAQMISGLKTTTTGTTQLATALYADGTLMAGGLSKLLPKTLAVLPPVPRY
ncbi:hypothetical protein IAT40_001729 [Kwoniella sp. CBS 6097]